jgi:hypothetical protein
MKCDPAVRDSGFDRSAIFLIAATGLSKLRIDDVDRQPPDMIGLYRVAISSNFRSAASGVASGGSSLNFILAVWSPCRWRRRDASRL